MAIKFEELYGINVNDKKEEKNGLNYLSWTYAVAEFSKRYPDFTYEVKLHEDDNGVKKPYIYDYNLGYMVFTSVTADGVTKEMWLPVMDKHNCAMKHTPYKVETAKQNFTVPSATMMDINKTIMRCLTKNLAMFGLGLYIYAGEDLPESLDDGEQGEPKKDAPKPEPVNVADTLCLVLKPNADPELVDKVDYFKTILNGSIEKVLIRLNKKDINDLTVNEMKNVIDMQKAGLAKRRELEAQQNG